MGDSKIAQFLRKGDCYAGIQTKWAILEEMARGDDDICNLKQSLDPLFTVPAGFFVADDLRHVSSYALAKKRADGTWKRAEAENTPKSKCPPKDKSSATEPLHAAHML